MKDLSKATKAQLLAVVEAVLPFMEYQLGPYGDEFDLVTTAEGKALQQAVSQLPVTESAPAS